MTKKELQQVKALTNGNNHNTARIYIARHVGTDTDLEIFTKIQEIYELLACMPVELIAFREHMLNNMFENIDKEEAEKIKACL